MFRAHRAIRNKRGVSEPEKLEPKTIYVNIVLGAQAYILSFNKWECMIGEIVNKITISSLPSHLDDCLSYVSMMWQEAKFPKADEARATWSLLFSSLWSSTHKMQLCASSVVCHYICRAMDIWVWLKYLGILNRCLHPTPVLLQQLCYMVNTVSVVTTFPLAALNLVKWLN